MKRIPLKRRQKGKTDYRKRLALLKSRKTRVIVRKSNKNIQVQFAHYAPDGDKIVTSAVGTDLKKYGWAYSLSSTPAAYLTGLLAGKRARKHEVTGGILDIGMYSPSPGARIFAALKGVVDAGVEIPYGEDIIPSEDRLHGKHIADEMAEKIDKVKEKIEADYE